MQFRDKLGLLGASMLMGMGVTAVPTIALAQDASPQAGAAAEEEIVITGSRIRRTPENAATPLIQVGREQLLNAGSANLVEYLADIPALQNSVTPEDTVGTALGAAGLNLLNLRNLGSERTLTLVDGRRHVGGSQGSGSVDADTIPRLLIKDVEIITGAGSAVYGADAVSGVVNFIQRDDYDGFEVDGYYGEAAQDTGQHNSRISALWGHNFFDSRLNVYVSGEYETNDEVTLYDLDWARRNEAILNVDTDQTAGAFAGPDGQIDNIYARDLVSLSRPRGGVLTLAHTAQPSGPADPDISGGVFGRAVAPPNNGSLCQPALGFPNANGSNCFTADPGFSYLFNDAGVEHLANFGTFRDPNGTQARTINIGGEGDPLNTNSTSLLPSQDAARFQTGFTFDLTSAIQLFGEAKYVHEQGYFDFQPAFFDVTIRPGGALDQGFLTALSAFEIGLDNAYLPAALRTAIQTNTRNVYDQCWTGVRVPSPGVGGPGTDPAGNDRFRCSGTAANPNFGNVVTTVADPRAQLRLFSNQFGERRQTYDRDTYRYVIGGRGDIDQIGFMNNIHWDAGYTYGKMNDTNVQTVLDVGRYALAADAVVDTAGALGTPGAIVCRARLINAAAPGTIYNEATNSDNFAADDPAVTGCVPIRIFGEGGVSDAARDYINFNQAWSRENWQQQFLAYASADLWDFWGAGPIGAVVGYEWRNDATEYVNDDQPLRLLFSNALGTFPKVDTSVSEFFTELQIPILRDAFLARSLDIGGAIRFSDYEQFGSSHTWNANIQWRPFDSIAFRGTIGEAQRVPNLGELFQPQGQTFLQVSDNCSSAVIAATPDPVVKQNRFNNCQALGVPADYVDPNPTTSNAGRLGGNPDLVPETSDSWTLSAIYTPSAVPRFSVVLDWYDIQINDIISSLTLQGIVNLCTDNPSPNMLACGLLTRDPTTFEIVDFLQSSTNFAKAHTIGLDFTVRYGMSLEDVIGHDWGDLDFALRGNYTIRNQQFADPIRPDVATADLDGAIQNPRVRFALNTTWTVGDFAFLWNLDWQSDQEILDERTLQQDLDARDPKYLSSGAFTQNDFSVVWNVTDHALLRGGVINAFDNDPPVQVQPGNIPAGAVTTTSPDNFDYWGRRFWVGFGLKF